MAFHLLLGLAVLAAVTAGLGQALGRPKTSDSPRSGVSEGPLYQREKTLSDRIKFQSDAPRKQDSNRRREKVVCGMVVLQPDASADAKTIVRPPKEATDMKIKRIKPPACND